MSQALAAEFLDTASDDSNQPARRWGRGFKLPQCEVRFGRYSRPPRSVMKSSPQNQKAHCHARIGPGSACSRRPRGPNTNAPPAPPGRARRPGPRESSGSLCSCAFQPPKPPRRAAVCRRGGERNNGWIKTERARGARGRRVAAAEARPRPHPPPLLLLHVAPNNDKVPKLPGDRPALSSRKTHVQRHQRRSTQGQSSQTMVTLAAGIDTSSLFSLNPQA